MTTATTTFNLNDECTAILRQPGVDAIREHFTSLGMESYLPKMLPGLAPGYVWKTQLWNMMSIVAPKFGNGFDPPIETAIELHMPDPAIEALLNSPDEPESPPEPAIERAVAMAALPMNQLPPLALGFLKHLSSQIGMCGEVCITAYAVYAQIVEKLECNDSLYCPDEDARKWFAAHGYESA